MGHIYFRGVLIKKPEIYFGTTHIRHIFGPSKYANFQKYRELFDISDINGRDICASWVHSNNETFLRQSYGTYGSSDKKNVVRTHQAQIYGPICRKDPIFPKFPIIDDPICVPSG